MSTYSPTVADVSRAVRVLDDNADFPECGEKRIGEYVETLHSLRSRVARELAWQFDRHPGTTTPRYITKNDVAVALIAHGATPFTVERHARAIAAIIRYEASVTA